MEDIGKGAYAMIAEMVAALNVDYDRLEELMDREDLSDDERGELMMLKIVAGECKSRDDALERIQQNALCVEVRSGWTPVGDMLTAEEFAILITTGAPAVRIRGELNEHNEPRRAARGWKRKTGARLGRNTSARRRTCCLITRAASTSESDT